MPTKWHVQSDVCPKLVRTGIILCDKLQRLVTFKLIHVSYSTC